MSLIQKSVFGDNSICRVSPDFTRQLTEELEMEILSILSCLNVSAVTIRFEAGVETREFVLKISQFLNKNGFKVYPNEVMMSEISRNEFSFQKHPSDLQFAILKIGPLI